MGRYMQRKGRLSNEVAVTEVSAQPPLGVRTRARTLALQRLQKPPEPPSPDPNSAYLQLRNRRLEKPSSSLLPSKHQGSSFSKSAASAEADGGVEVSFGENVLELETRDRGTRETTPCSLIRGSESIRTPASTTRNSASMNPRMRSSAPRDIPTAQEMEEFFAAAEQLQLRMFAEKYNFDPVNDCPLPGQYEWVKLDA